MHALTHLDLWLLIAAPDETDLRGAGDEVRAAKGRLLALPATLRCTAAGGVEVRCVEHGSDARHIWQRERRPGARRGRDLLRSE